MSTFGAMAGENESAFEYPYKLITAAEIAAEDVSAEVSNRKKVRVIPTQVSAPVSV
jgi:hypothetical protein